MIQVPERLTPPTVIAEIGCNHKGDFVIAKRLIKAAAEAGARVVKFQKRNPLECLTREQYESPHPVPSNSYGSTYGEHREALEFSMTEHAGLKEYAESLGVEWSTSVWDLTSARDVAGLAPSFIKVPSAKNHDTTLLAWLRDNYAGSVHVSCGMSTRDEIRQVVSLFADCPARLVLYACTSGYPVENRETTVLEVARLRDEFFAPGKCGGIGFSGHHTGIQVDLAALTLGATYIERHFTLNRAWKGTDHAASLEPEGLRRLVRDLGAVAEAWRYKEPEVLPVEMEQRRKLRGVA